MDKKVAKRELVNEIRQHLASINVKKGDSLKLDVTVSHQKITCKEKVYIIETRVKSISHNRITIEWYQNGERKDYSGEYPYSDKNVSYGVVMNVAAILWQKVNAA